MSSRVSKITVSNLKAVSELTADFNGCTAIITGGNNKGKSSFLRSLPDRIHGIKPDVILKKGEKEGYAEWLLTTGEKFIWSFENKTKAGEKLTFITSTGIKGSVTRELALRYFPPTFNVDDFLTAQPKKQKEILQKLVGLDFADVDKRYDAAYLDREGKNRLAKEQEIIFNDMPMPEQVQPVSLDDLMLQKAAIRNRLNTLYLSNKADNEKLRTDYQQQVETDKQQVDANNKQVAERTATHQQATDAVNVLRKLGYKGDAEQFIDKMHVQIGKLQTYHPPVAATYVQEMPDDAELRIIDEAILTATRTNQRAQEYTDWKAQEKKMQDAATRAGQAHAEVVKIDEEKMAMITGAKMPEGFSFIGDGIAYTGLPFTREQLSSSGIYIAALKLAAMTLGEVRTLHFDASFLDNPSLAEIEKWANSESLQLLIELPDRSGGDISYELINSNGKI